MTSPNVETVLAFFLRASEAPGAPQASARADASRTSGAGAYAEALAQGLLESFPVPKAGPPRAARSWP